MTGRKAFLHVGVVVAGLTFASAGRLGATMVVRLPLAQVAQKADRIVHATVVDVQSGRDASGLPATWVTLDVTRSVKGHAPSRLTIKQFGDGSSEAGGAGARVAGLPRYKSGEEVVLFLRADSALGFTSPVGFAQGAYRVRRDGGRRRVRGDAPEAPNRDLDEFLGEVARDAGGSE